MELLTALLILACAGCGVLGYILIKFQATASKKEELNLSTLQDQVKDSLEEIQSLNKTIDELINKKNELINETEDLDYDLSIAELNAQQKMNLIADDIEEAEAALQNLKNSISAGNLARLREQQNEEQEDFYKIHIDKKDLYEIGIIKELEYKLSDPRPLRMLIWSTYYQKKVTEMCNNVLGKDTVTGIYKITNANTKSCYIGQAVDVKKRFTEHIKCGLGIDTPPGSKLYKAMIKEGIENFTFELLEACAQDQLNEKERLFIDLYSSKEYGYNTLSGISKKEVQNETSNNSRKHN